MAYNSKLLGQRVQNASGARCYAIARNMAKPPKAVATCSQSDLEQAIKDKGIVAKETSVRFPANGPVRLVVEILADFRLKLEGFEHPVSPRGVQVV